MSRWHLGSSPETSLSWRGHGAAPVTVENPQESSGRFAQRSRAGPLCPRWARVRLRGGPGAHPEGAGLVTPMTLILGCATGWPLGPAAWGDPGHGLGAPRSL